MITANVLGQEIKVRCETVVSNSVNFLAVNFICDDAWQGYSKKAIFSNGEKTVAVVFQEGNSLVTDEGCCLVPFEVIEYPGFSLSLIGHKGDSIITTEPVFIPVKESGDIDGIEPQEPTPDQYAQIIEICEQSKQIADSVRADADSGLFKGEKGDKGDKGDSGSNVGAKTVHGGEIFNDYENNKALAAYSKASGKNTRAGTCGYKILLANTVDYKLMGNLDLLVQNLEESPIEEQYAIGDIVNLDLVYHHYGIFKIIGISDTPKGDGTHWVTVKPIETITTEDGKVVNLHVPTAEEISVESGEGCYSWIWCTDKPDAGEIMNHIAPIASGEDTVAAGDGAFVTGKNNRAIGQYAFCGGTLNEANYAAFAINKNNHALGEYSTAGGYSSYATKRFSTALGNRCIADGESAVARGTACLASGNGAVALGWGCEALGDYSFVSGFGCKAKGANNVVLGNSNTASREGAVALGKNNIASSAAFVGGDSNKGNGSSTIVLGSGNEANGTRSTAIGTNNQTNASESIAIGCGNQSNGLYGIAGGGYCITKYDYAIALGEQCLSQGRSSLAVGVKNEAHGAGSVALGLKTIAKGYGQTVVGYYNEVIGSGDPTFQKASDTALFVVGNGASDTSRSNAFVVYKDNSIKLGNTVVTEEQLKKLIALLNA